MSGMVRGTRRTIVERGSGLDGGDGADLNHRAGHSQSSNHAGQHQRRIISDKPWSDGSVGGVDVAALEHHHRPLDHVNQLRPGGSQRGDGIVHRLRGLRCDVTCAYQLSLRVYRVLSAEVDRGHPGWNDRGVAEGR